MTKLALANQLIKAKNRNNFIQLIRMKDHEVESNFRVLGLTRNQNVSGVEMCVLQMSFKKVIKMMN